MGPAWRFCILLLAAVHWVQSQNATGENFSTGRELFTMVKFSEIPMNATEINNGTSLSSPTPTMTLPLTTLPPETPELTPVSLEQFPTSTPIELTTVSETETVQSTTTTSTRQQIATEFAETSTRSSPNIVFIMVDDLGWNDIGYHGSEIRTPVLDRLANNGVKLENYYMAPVCGPTRAQFLSGKYSIHLGIHSGNIIACRPSGLPTQYPTIADKLKEQGYSTHLIGKWHAGFHTDAHLPNNRGFDTFRGFLLGHGDHYTHTRDYNRREYLDFYDNTTPYNQSWGVYSTEVITDRANELIIQSRNATDPMFMWVSYQAPHNPLQVPDKYLDMYSHIPIESRRRYAAMVTAIDIGVGQIIQSLKDVGKYENTVIVFSTDNGGDVGSGGSNYPLKGNKGSLYEGGVRGVGFVSSPLIQKPNRKVRDLMHVTDWLPTLLHIAGGSASSLDIDGINQWNTISNDERSSRMEILHNIYNKPRRIRRRNRKNKRKNNRRFDTGIKASLTVGPWKILTGVQTADETYPDPAVNPRRWKKMRLFRPRSRSQVQLYNRISDPFEQFNLMSENPMVTRFMLRKLKAYQNTIVDSVNGPKNHHCNPALWGGVWGPFV